MAKKMKLEELSAEEKAKARKISVVSIASAAIVCLILVGCFACTQDSPVKEMTDEQKASYWNASIIDVSWQPQTDATHNGVLKDFYAPRNARTFLDTKTGAMMIDFLLDEESPIASASVVLANEYGELVFEDGDTWEVKFSEKNEVLYMTVTDSDGKAVYYNSI